MKNIILNKSLVADIVQLGTKCDLFCTVIECSLLKLHENASLYACVRSNEGIPCRLYVSNSAALVEKSRDKDTEAEWIEAIINKDFVNIRWCCRRADGTNKHTIVAVGRPTPTIDKQLCGTMGRLSAHNNKVFVIRNTKKYTENEKEAFQKRSVVDLSSIDSSGVDIFYFEGAEKLIEKLLYGGCRELTVFVADTVRIKGVLKALDKLSRKAPFSNKITVVQGGTYAPKFNGSLLVGCAADMPHGDYAKVFFSASYAEGEGVGVSVGQNTADLIPDSTGHRLKSHTLHYITSIMSELVLHAITGGEYNAKRLFKVNAKTLATETIIKED